MRIIWTIHLLLFPLFFCCAPDAERSNPFDPQSSHYKGTGGLFGRVTSYYDRPIDAAQIQILPGLKGVLSDGRGDYAMSDIPGGEYLVTASKEGYAPDTSEVTIKAGKTNQVNFELDGLPYFRNGQIRTAHIDRWWPGPTYKAFLTVEVEDPDGMTDIDSVWAYVRNLNFWKKLSFLPEENNFEGVVSGEELPDGNLYYLIGNPINFVATDKVGEQSISVDLYVVRIIEETPVALSPINLQTTIPSPRLIWDRFELPYNFSFQTEVLRIDVGVETPVWKGTNIPSDSTSITVSDSLAAGTYYWTVAAVDGFGNLSRSKEAAFQVE